ncbi:restriction endonuclease subunit S [Verminephrobacter eiseniae]|uniref:restriction endonuclease subunit S n=1 Tax=Verminephrobacter eiseniae TaxID=364317 RepID=UPI0022382821|nr:restriction endonuclease subunit S [Verminephrobacter eiseniae]MCW5237942.1 restriction endonuclease subunit S [Verminephrobacter eiseniae]
MADSAYQAELEAICPDGWTVVPLTDAAFFQEGPGILAKDFQENGVPLIRLKGVEGDFVTLEGCNFLAPEKVADKWSHFRLERGDLVISTSASFGRVSEVTDEAEGAISYTGLIRFRPKTKEIDAGFLRAFLGSAVFMRQVEAMASGSVIRHFGPMHLKQMALPLPPNDEQRAIGEMATLIAERLRNLRQTNATLEAIAAALFKFWFVDFDGMSQEDMQESELGLIPKGWRMEEIGKLVQCVGGATPSTKDETFWQGGTHHWATPKDLSGLQAPVLTTTERLITDAGVARISSGLLPAGTLLMSSRAPIGYLAIAAVPVAINQGFIAMPPGGALSPVWLLFWAKANMEAIKQKANGSTFMEISKAAFRPIKVVAPSQDVLARFDEVVAPMLERIKNNEHHISTLSALRDALLPRLISGRLRIAETTEYLRSQA